MNTHKVFSGLLTFLTYIIALAMFFPIFWMVLTSFKTEAQAFAFPPPLLFLPTLDNWNNALCASPYLKHFTNTVIITFGSTLAAFCWVCRRLIAFPSTRRSVAISLCFGSCPPA